MKKILMAIGAAAMIVGATTSCKEVVGMQVESESKAFADSMAVGFGTFYGQQLKNQLPQLQAQFGDKFNEEDFVRGVQAALRLDTADLGYMIGYSTGIQAVFQLAQWAQSGVNVDPSKVSRIAIKSMNDTAINPQNAYMQFQMLSGRMQDIIQKRTLEAQKGVAAENRKAGEEYIAKVKAENPEVKTSESGLAYLITEAGEETKVPDGANVQVIYTGRHISGEEFDSSKGNPVEFNVNQVIAGFKEGLMLLGKGGKATIYIPGNLAYGENGAPNGGIGPDETLVFDIEVVDYAVPEPAPAE